MFSAQILRSTLLREVMSNCLAAKLSLWCYQTPYASCPSSPPCLVPQRSPPCPRACRKPGCCCGTGWSFWRCATTGRPGERGTGGGEWAARVEAVARGKERGNRRLSFQSGGEWWWWVPSRRLPPFTLPNPWCSCVPSAPLPPLRNVHASLSLQQLSTVPVGWGAGEGGGWKVAMAGKVLGLIAEGHCGLYSACDRVRQLSSSSRSWFSRRGWRVR
jgi:hypothetical protein